MVHEGDKDNPEEGSSAEGQKNAHTSRNRKGRGRGRWKLTLIIPAERRAANVLHFATSTRQCLNAFLT